MKYVRAVRSGLALVGVLTVSVRTAMVTSSKFRDHLIAQAKKRANDPHLSEKKRKQNAATAVYWQTYPW